MKRFLFACVMVLGAGRSAHAQLTEADDQSAFSSPAPIPQTYFVPGSGRIAVRAVGGQLKPREGSSMDTSPLWGGIAAGTYALSDRWYVGALGLFAQGSAGPVDGRIYGGLGGVGGRLLGQLGDVFALSGLVGFGVVGSRVGLGDRAVIDGRRDVSARMVVGTLALQGDISPSRWFSIVPFASVYGVLSTSLSRGGISVSADRLNKAWLVPGLDVWVYPDPAKRHSYFNLGGESNVGQEARATLFQVGYTMAFGN